MTTYTIAMLDDTLIATAPDNSDIESAAAAELKSARLSRVDSDGNEYFYTAADCQYFTGLILSDDLPDDADVVYGGTQQGWLEDENGVNYEYAYKA